MDHPMQNVELSEEAIEKLLMDWNAVPKGGQQEFFASLPRSSQEELFFKVSSVEQKELYGFLPSEERRSWVRLLPPDDAADLLQELEADEKAQALSMLDISTRNEVSALLAYREDQAGGLMNSRFARLRPDMTAEEAIRYLREQTRAQVEMIYYAYVLDAHQKLLGVVSLRLLFGSSPLSKVSEIMIQGDQLITVKENQDQEEIARLFSNKEHLALPVVDAWGCMRGIVTVDDVVQVVNEEATEDIQKFGGVEAFDEPYFKVGFFQMIKKRVVWLLVLFVGEMFTAVAMGHYEKEISKAVVLALFIPLIISSGGNSGSQASTLVIRAMALGEVRLRDWWKVFLRESASGLLMGLVLGVVGLCRILFWPSSLEIYGEHFGRLSLAVGFSLVGVVAWGTLAGSMLPFFLKRLRLDPAAASAPFVATLVDVTGLVIYFTVAHVFLSGTLL